MNSKENAMMQRERLASGYLYTDMDESMAEERLRGKELVYDFNHTRPSEQAKREALIRRLMGKIGKNFWIEPPLHVAYGSQIAIGDNFYANFNLVVVDDGKVLIGDNVMIAPNVTISTTGHPVDPTVRITGQQFSLAVTIEDNVWIGSGAIINPGVTIGRNSVIGAGSVVTKDVPCDVVAAGVPCRVLRSIGERDRIFYHKGRRFADIPVETAK
ncbi:maltose acetyltransferase domain-containing protein [Serratia oryzae]|nr:maltose acetyltransferase domain-containing protein [Serratia oryzae]VXC94979.1 thiogalactoside acetyltransferase [Enterobacterales bacterium 8AC]